MSPTDIIMNHENEKPDQYGYREQRRLQNDLSHFLRRTFFPSCSFISEDNQYALQHHLLHCLRSKIKIGMPGQNHHKSISLKVRYPSLRKNAEMHQQNSESYLNLLHQNYIQNDDDAGIKLRALTHQDELCLASISIKVKDRRDELLLPKDTEVVKQVGQEMRVPVPQSNLPGIGQVASLALKQVLCGTIAGAISSVVVSPFETLRTRVVAQRGGSTAAEVLGTVSHREGIPSLMRGTFSLAMIESGLNRGVQFGVYEAVKRYEMQKLGRDPQWLPGVAPNIQMASVAGAIAGLGSTLAVYPIRALKERLHLKPAGYSSVYEAAKTVIKEEGVRELFRGSIPAIMTLVPQAIASFYTYENVYSSLNERFKESENTPCKTALSSVTAGTAAGLVAGALTYPVELARKKINITADLSKGTSGAFRYNNLSEALYGTVQNEGWMALYRGFIVQAAEFVPMTAVSFMVYEVAKRVFVAQNEERRDEVKG